MKKTAFLVCGIIALSACGGGSGSSEKDLFSLWREATTDLPLDLTGGDFNQDIEMAFFFSSGAQCNCDFRVIGDQSSGAYTRNSCFYVTGSSAGGDPGCNALNESGTYTKENNTLTAQTPSGPVVYR